jgi:predicted kinase
MSETIYGGKRRKVMGVKIVYGAPCSGKSTYVREKIKENDIVFDYDAITRALTNSQQHLSKREVSHRYVLDIKLTLIKRYRMGSKAKDLWIISTFLTDSFKKYVHDLKPEYIKMDVSMEECLARLDKDEMRPDKEEWKQKIIEWFETNGQKQGKPINKEGKEAFNPYREL